MAVLLFPVMGRPTPASEPARDDAPGHAPRPTRLHADALDALLSIDFYPRVQADAESGLALMDADDEAELARYLSLHGLRLPKPVDAALVLELCNDLRWSFAPAVSAAARAEATEPQVGFAHLNAVKRAYVQAVASQDLPAARDAARLVITERARQVFLY